MSQPKILCFDIETSPIEAYVWDLYDQNIGISQIVQDWTILAWAAKWHDDPAHKVMYMDTSRNKNVRDDKALVEGLWNLLDQADIVITQNGKKFDVRKFNARAAIHGLSPVGGFRNTDTYREGKTTFGFTSHSLEYMSDKINKKYKKLKHAKFPGFELWKEVLAGNKQAWAEMKEYCINDVLATDELYGHIRGWIKTHNLAVFHDDSETRCVCGSTNLYKKGFVYTDAGKFQGYKCKDCGKRPRGRTNILTTEKRRSMTKEAKRGE